MSTFEKMGVRLPSENILWATLRETSARISMWRSDRQGAGHGNRLQEEPTTMSSLANRKGRPLFVVQSGIVTWEDPEPIADWRRKTLSIVSRTLPNAIDLLWAVIASRPTPLGPLF